MTTECWFRNPRMYIKELVETGQTKIAWDRGTLTKSKTDPNKFADLYFGAGVRWEALVIGTQGAAHIDNEHTMENPKAVYPVWDYATEDGTLEILEDMLAFPAGEDEERCASKKLPADERPVLGQEHRVVLINLPNAGQLHGKRLLRELKVMQQDYPDVIMHIHGSYSYRVAFGFGFRSADIEPRTLAAKGAVTLPNGSEVLAAKTYTKRSWTVVIGFEPDELKVPRNRCMFNIKSAVWASEHYAELYDFRTNKLAELDTTTPTALYKGGTTKAASPVNRTKLKMASPGDKYTCGTCSLMDDCKYYRDGAVCSVPGSEPRELSKYFGTRDSATILDGLAILMKSNIKRYERGLQEEVVDGELNSEVSKLQSSLFEQGVKLAKLLDPELRSGAKVQVNVGGNSAVQVNNGNPRQAIAAAIRELEARGIPREKITSKMIEGLFEGMNDAGARNRAIEAEVFDAETVEE